MKQQTIQRCCDMGGGAFLSGALETNAVLVFGCHAIVIELWKLIQFLVRMVVAFQKFEFVRVFPVANQQPFCHYLLTVSVSADT